MFVINTVLSISYAPKEATVQTLWIRGKLPQKNPVEHEFEANTQAIINMSRKRLCNQASKETKEAWELFLEENVQKELPELKEVCVRECVYRGFCPELYPCGYSETKEFRSERKEYVDLIKNNPLKK